MNRQILLLLSLLSFAGCAHKHANENLAAKPVIAFDQEEFDFGKVAEGIELKHVFIVKNDGNKVLEQINAYSTCGCTFPKLAKTSLNPGESISMPVSLDTSMKQDEITKTVNISSSDPERPVVILSMHMNVENRHKGLSKGAKAKILTDEKCTGCHVAQGTGLFGKELFEADCAMCHGEKAEGKFGPSLIRDFSDKAMRKHIFNVTAYGSKKVLLCRDF